MSQAIDYLTRKCKNFIIAGDHQAFTQAAYYGVARQLAAGAASANTALTVGVTRVSILCITNAVRFKVGSGAQTATATSNYIGVGERLEVLLPANANIALIRAGGADGAIELSELS
jgi:hypothetical protein